MCRSVSPKIGNWLHFGVDILFLTLMGMGPLHACIEAYIKGSKVIFFGGGCFDTSPTPGTSMVIPSGTLWAP